MDWNHLQAVIFDLDGVMTDTASLHARAWKHLFDGFLWQRAAATTTTFQPFEDADYHRYVDGKPRLDGVRSFLLSRGVELPVGNEEDEPEASTLWGLGNRKNLVFQQLVMTMGVKVYDSSVRWVSRARARGLRTALISASRNCIPVATRAGIITLFDAVVDGLESARLQLRGKPAPDVFLEAARRLGVRPSRAAVVEDAQAGVQAGRRGHFFRVVGVDRVGQAAALRQQGADVVIRDLSQLPMVGGFDSARELPEAMERLGEIDRLRGGRRLAVCLDYDGTLTPIVERPEWAVLPETMRARLEELSQHCVVAVVSGRGLADVRKRVGIEGLVYAGSHGFEVEGPGLSLERATEFLPILDRAERELRQAMHGVSGALVERKRFSIAVHDRLVNEERVHEVQMGVDQVLSRHPRLRRTFGKRVQELQPDLRWDKGRAVRWLLEELNLQSEEVLPLYVGDDYTDEMAFEALGGWGLGILVREENRPTAARYALNSVDEVGRFLEALARMVRGDSR